MAKLTLIAITRSENRPASLRLDVQTVSADHPAGVANDGYWGILVRSRTRYTAKFYARASVGYSGSMTLAIHQAPLGEKQSVRCTNTPGVPDL